MECGSVTITLPHWITVGNTTSYYLYNQQGSSGSDIIINAPYIEDAGQDSDQMLFQGNDTLINPDSNNKQLIIPPQGTATVVIQAQYYTVMNDTPKNFNRKYYFNK